MSAFPYTAPRFTEEERQKEIALLSDEERELINQELNGSDILKENEDETELYINRMEKELEKIPLEEKTEYEEALINAPELVKSESGFLRFLRKHNYDTAVSNSIFHSRLISFRRSNLSIVFLWWLLILHRLLLTTWCRIGLTE